eukprot:superscaffoldBa00004940_g19666
MAVAYGAVTQPGLFSQQYPPPLLPKPGKDNLRLQKLLKRTAKKKASAQASQNAGPFRSSLSPVNEASPDLERSDHSTPPRTPETPFSFYSVQQPPRITIRPLYQHVASPYPQRAAYGRAARFSPQLVATPSYSYSQHVTTVPSYSAATHPSGVSPTPGPVVQLAGPKRSLQASSLSEATAPVVEVKRPAFSTFPETHPGLRPATAVATTQPKPISPGPTPYPTTGAFQRPKTPTQLAHKSKSSYRGLTPAEYAAYGGIKTYSPAFGITSSKTATQEEVKATKEESAEFKTTSQEPSVKAHPTAEVTKVKETPKDVDKPQLRDESVSATPSIPIIVVSQASDTSATTVTQETSKVSSQVAAKQEQSVVQETPKAKPPTAEGKTPEKEKKTQKVETPVQEVAKPKAKTPEAKHPPPKADDQDPLKAVRKLLGKVQTGTTETKVSEQKEPAKPKTPPKPKIEGSKPSTAVPALPVKVPAESTAIEDKGKDKKAEISSVVKSTPMKKEGDKVLLEAEPLLKVIKKPKGLKSNLSGWSRLKKHMVVEQEEPKFPETDPQKEATEQDQKEEKKVDDKAVKKPDETPDAQDENQTKDTPKATQMWDAVLFQMFSTKENIMHQIELSKTEEEKQQEIKDEPKEIPSFAFRLPVLLFSPKFDAKRLKEAASRPVTKISTVFEMGLIGRKGKDEEPKDFNRTARGFNPS